MGFRRHVSLRCAESSNAHLFTKSIQFGLRTSEDRRSRLRNRKVLTRYKLAERGTSELNKRGPHRNKERQREPDRSKLGLAVGKCVSASLGLYTVVLEHSKLQLVRSNQQREQGSTLVMVPEHSRLELVHSKMAWPCRTNPLQQFPMRRKTAGLTERKQKEHVSFQSSPRRMFRLEISASTGSDDEIRRLGVRVCF